jgi:hypothetical protein
VCTGEAGHLQKQTTHRQYKDFESLYWALLDEYPGLIVPPVPGQNWATIRDKWYLHRNDPFLEAWRRKGLTMFLEHLATCPDMPKSMVLYQFMNASTQEWQLFLTKFQELHKRTYKASPFLVSSRVLFGARHAIADTRRVHCPAIDRARQWALRLEPEIRSIKSRLGKLHHDITQLRQISPPPELGSFVSLGVDETVSALDGISDALARAEATPTSRLEEWLLLLLVDVSFYCKLGQSVLDTLKTLDRIEELRHTKLKSPVPNQWDIDGLSADIETGTKRFEVAYEQLLAWKQPLCMRICHTFAKFGINVMDSDVDWDSKDAQHWLSLLPNGY